MAHPPTQSLTWAMSGLLFGEVARSKFTSTHNIFFRRVQPPSTPSMSCPFAVKCMQWMTAVLAHSTADSCDRHYRRATTCIVVAVGASAILGPRAPKTLCHGVVLEGRRFVVLFGTCMTQAVKPSTLRRHGTGTLGVYTCRPTVERPTTIGGPPPPPRNSKRDHRGNKRNLPLGKSGRANSGTHTFGSQTPPSPPSRLYTRGV